MKNACVIGWPIEHSRSPLIHGTWLKRYGIEGTYTKVAVKPEDLETFLSSLAKNGLAGCNVTIPHKEAAFRFATEKEASARAIGAANTLWLEDGVLHAANTDTYGYMAYLAQRYPDWRKKDAPVSVLGAGGAARAIVFGLLEAGVSEVRVFNRTLERAEALAHDFGAHVKALEWKARSSASRDSNLVINTTAVGLKGEGSLDMDFHGFRSSCIISDIVYVPLKTALLKDAEKQACELSMASACFCTKLFRGFRNGSA